MRIDSHQHFWRYNPSEYAWISDAMSNLRQDFLPPNLAPLLNTLNFDGSVVVQARQTLAETEWLLTLAENHNSVKGVVGWVDLCSSTVHKQLDKYAQHQQLKGVRHVVHDEPDPQFMARPEFQRGIATLAEYGLTYDLLLYPFHLPLAIDLVEQFPKQLFVLDHIGKPQIGARLLSPWRVQIMRLGSCENVYCKLSGMVTETEWGLWKPDDFKEYLDVVLEAFGPKRVMVGSDWPVCTISGSYNATIDIVEQYITGFSHEDQEAIMGDNCVRFYNILG